MSKVGVVIVGVNGAVATTLIAGVELMIRGLAPRLGMVTERTDARATELTSLLDFAPLEDLVFAGWDVRHPNVFEAAVHHKVLPREQLEAVKDKLTAVTPWPAVFAKRYAEKVIGDNVVSVKSYREEVALLTKNVEDFKRARGLERVVMVQPRLDRGVPRSRPRAQERRRLREGARRERRHDHPRDALLLRPRPSSASPTATSPRASPTSRR